MKIKNIKIFKILYTQCHQQETQESFGVRRKRTCWLKKEDEEMMNIIMSTEEIKKVFGKVWRDKFANGSAANILLANAKISSGKSLVIIKNNLIDAFLDYIKPYLTFLVSRHTRRRNRNIPQ